MRQAVWVGRVGSLGFVWGRRRQPVIKTHGYAVPRGPWLPSCVATRGQERTVVASANQDLARGQRRTFSSRKRTGNPHMLWSPVHAPQTTALRQANAIPSYWMPRLVGRHQTDIAQSHSATLVQDLVQENKAHKSLFKKASAPFPNTCTRPRTCPRRPPSAPSQARTRPSRPWSWRAPGP